MGLIDARLWYICPANRQVLHFVSRVFIEKCWGHAQITRDQPSPQERADHSRARFALTAVTTRNTFEVPVQRTGVPFTPALQRSESIW
jgi:hypothetical protein